MRNISEQKELIDKARKAASAIYLATDEKVAEDISLLLSRLTKELEEVLELNTKYQKGLFLIVDPLETQTVHNLIQIAREALA